MVEEDREAPAKASMVVPLIIGLIVLAVQLWTALY